MRHSFYFSLSANVPCFVRPDLPTTSIVFRSYFAFKFLCFYASMLVQQVKHENSPTKTMLRAIYGQASKSVGYKTYFARIKLQAAILYTVPFWCENSAWCTITYMYCFYHAVFFTPMLIWSSVCRYVVGCF